MQQQQERDQRRCVLQQNGGRPRQRISTDPDSSTIVDESESPDEPRPFSVSLADTKRLNMRSSGFSRRSDHNEESQPKSKRKGNRKSDLFEPKMYESLDEHLILKSKSDKRWSDTFSFITNHFNRHSDVETSSMSNIFRRDTKTFGGKEKPDGGARVRICEKGLSTNADQRPNAILILDENSDLIDRIQRTDSSQEEIDEGKPTGKKHFAQVFVNKFRKVLRKRRHIKMVKNDVREAIYSMLQIGAGMVKVNSPMVKTAPKKLSSLAEAFEMFDTNCDGHVSSAELKNLFTSVGYDVTKEEAELMVGIVDKDNSGAIEFNEFVALMTKATQESEEAEEISEAFKIFDQDGDGKVSIREIYTILHSMGEKVSWSEAKWLVREADINGDGSLDLEEFIAIFRSPCVSRRQSSSQKSHGTCSSPVESGQSTPGSSRSAPDVDVDETMFKKSFDDSLGDGIDIDHNYSPPDGLPPQFSLSSSLSKTSLNHSWKSPSSGQHQQQLQRDITSRVSAQPAPHRYRRKYQTHQSSRRVSYTEESNFNNVFMANSSTRRERNSITDEALVIDSHSGSESGSHRPSLTKQRLNNSAVARRRNRSSSFSASLHQPPASAPASYGINTFETATPSGGNRRYSGKSSGQPTAADRSWRHQSLKVTRNPALAVNPDVFRHASHAGNTSIGGFGSPTLRKNHLSIPDHDD